MEDMKRDAPDEGPRRNLTGGRRMRKRPSQPKTASAGQRINRQATRAGEKEGGEASSSPESVLDPSQRLGPCVGVGVPGRPPVTDPTEGEAFLVTISLRRRQCHIPAETVTARSPWPRPGVALQSLPQSLLPHKPSCTHDQQEIPGAQPDGLVESPRLTSPEKCPQAQVTDLVTS